MVHLHLLSCRKTENCSVGVILLITVTLLSVGNVTGRHYDFNHTQEFGQDTTQLPWNLRAIDIENAWEITKGEKNITVAVIDSGIVWNATGMSENSRWKNQVELSGKLGEDDDGNGYIDDFYGWDFSNDDNTPDKDPNGISPHGTGVASLICSQHNNSQLFGIAPNVSIMNLRVLDGSGNGFIADIYKAIKYAINQNVSVINLSIYFLHTNIDLEAWNELFNTAIENDIAIVAITGNDFSGSVSYPARASQVIAVGAINSDYEPAPFSNYGSTIELVAPGVGITVAGTTKTTTTITGTSIAAPHVAGTIALMKSVRNDLSIQYLRDTLHYAAKDIVSYGWDEKSGYGIVNASKSIDSWMNFEKLDYDGDGLSNQLEISQGLDITSSDTDLDKLPDNYELKYGFNPLDPNDGNEDYDNDGISNFLEYLDGTDPTVPNNSTTALSNTSDISKSNLKQRLILPLVILNVIKRIIIDRKKIKCRIQNSIIFNS